MNPSDMFELVVQIGNRVRVPVDFAPQDRIVIMLKKGIIRALSNGSFHLTQKGEEIYVKCYQTFLDETNEL